MSRTVKILALVIIVAIAGGVSYGVYVATSHSPAATAKYCPGQVNATSSSSSTVVVPNDASLISQAKGEGGSFKWITTTGQANATQIATAFECDFPWATVNVDAVTTGTDIETAVDGEFSANDHTIDVVSSGYSTLDTLNGSGDIANFANTVAEANYPSGFYYPQTPYTPLYSSYYGIAYNTGDLSGSAVPSSWQALTGAQFKGELVMDAPSTLGESGTTFAGLSLVMSNASWYSLMDGIAANNPTFAASASDAITDVVQGLDQVAVGENIAEEQEAAVTGAPIAWQWLSPVPETYSAAALLQDAPQPALAELFVEWMSSLHGQVAWDHTGREAVVADGGGSIIPSGDTAVAVTNIYSSAEQTYWDDTFTNIFGAQG